MMISATLFKRLTKKSVSTFLPLTSKPLLTFIRVFLFVTILFLNP
jgi:hypothetical protein